MPPPPRVSVCVPTLDGARDLERLLPALGAQELEGELELCVIDSSSTDDTVERLRAFGARVEVIPRADFQHGRTRNVLAKMARGPVCVFLSQDACPSGPSFLRHLLSAFDDPKTAGASARILPPPGVDPLTARTVLADREASAEPLIFEGAERESPPLFNDVASALRRSVWEAVPFPEVDFGEDLAWARAALAAGHRLRFAPEAVVFHAHRYGPAQALERYRTDARFHQRSTGRRVRPSLASCLKGVLSEVRNDLRHVLSGPPRDWWHLLRSPGLRGAQVWGQYLGSRPEPGEAPAESTGDR